MSFEFEEEQTINYISKQEPKGIVGFLIKNKIAKDTQQANMIMIGLIIVLILISFVSIRSLRTPTGGDINEYDPLLDVPQDI